MLLYQRARKHIPLKVNNSEDFRDSVIFMPTRAGMLLPLYSSYANPYVYYEIITKQLNSGDNLFRIDTIDGNDNENEGSVITINVPDRVLPPRFLTATISGTTATITWEHSVDGPPDRYALFGTSDISLAMDRVNEFNGISVDGSITSMTVSLPTPGTYRFTVDSKIGTELSDNFITVDVTSPASAIVPPKVINEISLTEIDIGQLDIFATNIPTGKLNLRFVWVHGDQVASFNLYHDGGTGTVDFGSPITFNRQTAIVQNFTTEQISFHNVDTTFKIVVRAVTADGVEDTNTFENTVILNGSVPPDADSVMGGTCLC